MLAAIRAKVHRRRWWERTLTLRGATVHWTTLLNFMREALYFTVVVSTLLYFGGWKLLLLMVVYAFANLAWVRVQARIFED